MKRPKCICGRQMDICLYYDSIVYWYCEMDRPASDETTQEVWVSLSKSQKDDLLVDSERRGIFRRYEKTSV